MYILKNSEGFPLHCDICSSRTENLYMHHTRFGVFVHCQECYEEVSDRESRTKNSDVTVRCISCSVPMNLGEAEPRLSWSTKAEKSTEMTYWCPQCWKERYLKPEERTRNKKEKNVVHKVVVV